MSVPFINEGWASLHFTTILALTLNPTAGKSKSRELYARFPELHDPCESLPMVFTYVCYTIHPHKSWVFLDQLNEYQLFTKTVGISCRQMHITQVLEIAETSAKVRLSVYMPSWHTHGTGGRSVILNLGSRCGEWSAWGNRQVYPRGKAANTN
jgi:hypothetical protein